jgi:hypothetical protein
VDARAAVAHGRSAILDGPVDRRRRLLAAREEATVARLALRALEDGASDEERRAIGATNRALQRLVLQLDIASRDG